MLFETCPTTRETRSVTAEQTSRRLGRRSIPHELFRHKNSIHWLEGERLARFAFEDGVKIQFESFGCAVRVLTDDDYLLQVGLVMVNARFNDGLQGRFHAVGSNFAGPEHRARNVNYKNRCL